MNLASVLIKKIISENDVDAWADLHKHYLAEEYSKIYDVISHHFTEYSAIPSFESLKLSVRDKSLLEKVFSLEKSESVDVPCKELLDYLKNEYTQIEIMSAIEKYIDNSIAVDSAEESLDNLQAIVVDVESKVDLKDVENDMRRLPLFFTDEEMSRNIPLSLNSEYDSEIQFSPKDLILIGGMRGAGKSLTCANIAANTFEKKSSVMYFTIEMDSRAILQRICSVSTNVSMSALQNRNLSVPEWERVAVWWSSRFEEGEAAYKKYLMHRSFEQLHSEVIKSPLKVVQVDIIYDPVLSLTKIRSEIDKKVLSISPRVIIVDYINQIKKQTVNSKHGQYEWMEQIEISKALKSLAQHYEIPIIAPYQIDSTGEARFAKGILDAADAAFTINTHQRSDNCITFACSKMRNAEIKDFTSTINWKTLKVGPESATVMSEEKEEVKGESSTDIG